MICADVLSGEQPRLVWSTPQRDLALRGQTKKLKCIYSGLSVQRSFFKTTL